MSLTTTEEALVRELLAQQAAILSLAENEATIQSKLGATKVTLSDLTPASAVGESDLLLTRQGTTDKSLTASTLAAYTGANIPNDAVTFAKMQNIATQTFLGRSTAGTGDIEALTGSQAFTSMGGIASLAENGWQKLPSGLIIQWGQIGLIANGGPTNGFYYASDVFSFPIAFPNACLIPFATPQDTSGVEGGSSVSGWTTTTISVVVQTTAAGFPAYVNVLAIGY